MSYNFYLNEIEWSYREAQLNKALERKRQLAEAKAARLAQSENPEPAGTIFPENVNAKKPAKETLSWN